MTVTCALCPADAAVLDRETGRRWCIECAVALLRAGEPILDYDELPGGEAYTQELARGTTQTLPFA